MSKKLFFISIVIVALISHVPFVFSAELVLKNGIKISGIKFYKLEDGILGFVRVGRHISSFSFFPTDKIEKVVGEIKPMDFSRISLAGAGKITAKIIKVDPYHNKDLYIHRDLWSENSEWEPVRNDPDRIDGLQAILETEDGQESGIWLDQIEDIADCQQENEHILLICIFIVSAAFIAVILIWRKKKLGYLLVGRRHK